MEQKWVYFWGNGEAEGRAAMKDILGGKGANLHEMTHIGLPVPPGFTISAECCDYYSKNHEQYPTGMREEVEAHLERLEELMGKKLGDTKDPLLVSVRSGAAQSMPGMMDTVLNLGLSPASVQGLAEQTGNERFAWDSYRRFIQMFGDVVMNVPHHQFEEALDEAKTKYGAAHDTDLTTEHLKEVVEAYKKVYEASVGNSFPEDPEEQLFLAIHAVFDSWNNERAIKYRQMNDIRGLLGTAVNVVAMVFGNMGDDSGTGVAFTRDPSTGENRFFGEVLMNAQGEDVVAGIRTPQSLDILSDTAPKAYDELKRVRNVLENHYHDMQDLEFTIQQGHLYMLQTRNAKRTIFSWLRSQVEMVDEGLIDEETAVKRIPAGEFNKLFAPVLDGEYLAKEGLHPVTKGLNASPGGACGEVVFSADDAEKAVAAGKKVILVRIETSPEDIGGMAVAEGILTARGGMTSHAAVVARGMGCPCVAGAGELHINYKSGEMQVGDLLIKAGDLVAIDGFTGSVYAHVVPVKPSEIVQVLEGQIAPEDSPLYGYYDRLMGWVDQFRKLGVRTNADTPNDTRIAVLFGAEGIGLTRTEHMFFESDRITAMREMILADDVAQRETALAKLLPMQQGDFEGIFRALAGRPATIRLLDPPLHEFLPHDVPGAQAVAEDLGITPLEVLDAVEDLKEFNPMLGFRGCRLAVVYPEILRMQVRAIMQAALVVAEEEVTVLPEIMIPLVGHVAEFNYCKQVAEEEINTVFKEAGKRIGYRIGTMIEVPRAALTAGEIAEQAEFFSFGTNDLTQMTCGFSRDDSARFLKPYVEDTDKGFYEYDPFAVLDQTGVGRLVKLAVEEGRAVNPTLKLGICGEHGGEPKTVGFCHDVGLDYVSCSPFRVPIARLAAAQASLKSQ